METLVSLDITMKGTHLTDKQFAHGYLEEYEVLFYPYRFKPVNIFEVGYWFGGSCQLWDLYFEYPKIRAIDVRVPRNRYHEGTCVTRYIRPAGNIQLSLIDIRKLSPNFFSDFPLDIAIDDGSHQLWDQLTFLKLVYPHVKEGGMLIIEDLQDWENQKPHFDLVGIPYKVYDLREQYGPDSLFLLFEK